MLIRKPDQISQVTGIPAGMVDGVQATVFSDLEAAGIAELRAVVEGSPLLQLLDQRRAADTGAVEIFIPERQILDRRQKTGCTDRVEIGNAQAETDIATAGRIAIGDVLDDFGMIVPEMAARHSKR